MNEQDFRELERDLGHPPTQKEVRETVTFLNKIRIIYNKPNTNT